MSQEYPLSFVKDNVIVTVGHLLIYMKGIILMPIIIKTVGVTIYGGYTLLLSLLGFAFGISSFGVGIKARRFLPSAGDMRMRRELFYPQFFFQLLSLSIISLVFIVLNRQINLFIFKNEITYAALIIPFYLISHLLYSQGSEYFRYTARVPYMTAVVTCFPYIFIGFVVLFWYLNMLSINVLVLAQIFSSIIVAAPCFYIILKEIKFKIIWFDAKALLEDIKLGFPLVLNFIVDFILSGGDRYFIALFLSVTAVGYYSPGYALGSLIILIPKAMGTAVPQLLSQAVDQNDESEAQKMVNYSLRIFLLIAIPFTAGSLILAKPILTLLANREVAEHAYLVTPIVALGTVFYGLNLIFANVLFVQLKTSAMLKMNLYASLFNLVGNFILLLLFKNIIVAAVTTFLSYFVVFIYIYKIITEDWIVNFQPIAIAKSLLASLFMLGVLLLVSSHFHNTSTLLMIVVNLFLGILTYFGALLTFKTFSSNEIFFIKSCFLRLPLLSQRPFRP